MRRPPWPLVMWIPVRTTQLWIVCCTRSCTRDGRWRGAQATARRPTHPRHAGSRGRPCPPPRGAAQARGCHPIKMTAMVGGGLARRMGYRVGPSPSPCRQIGVETMGNPREPTVSRGGTLRLSRTERRRLFPFIFISARSRHSWRGPVRAHLPSVGWRQGRRVRGGDPPAPPCRTFALPTGNGS